jgi:hypothetical protein
MEDPELAEHVLLAGLFEIFARFGTVKRPGQLVYFPPPRKESADPSELKTPVGT